MVDDVLVTEPFGIVFGSIVGVGPDVALVGHKFMTGVVYTVIYPRDDLLFGSSVGEFISCLLYTSDNLIGGNAHIVDGIVRIGLHDDRSVVRDQSLTLFTSFAPPFYVP